MEMAALGAVFGLALLDWAVVARKALRIEYVVKPAVMAALFAWLMLSGGWQGPLVWFGLALLASAAGDELLLFGRRLFIPGVGAFLIANVLYVIGLNQRLAPFTLPAVLMALAALAVFAWLYPRIRAGVSASPGGVKLQIPVLAYSLVLTAMMLSAGLTLLRPEWQPGAAWLAAIGGILFFLSDTLLAFRLFVGRFPNDRVLSMIAYHLGQVGLIVGAVLNYSV